MRTSILSVLLLGLLLGCNKGKGDYNSGYSDKDTVEIDRLMKQSYESADKGNPDEGLNLGRNALSLSRKVGWSRGIATSHNNIAINFFISAAYDSAAIHYEKAIVENERSGNKVAVGVNYANIAALYDRMNLLNESAHMYDSAIAIFEKNKKLRYKFTTYGNAGAIYYRLRQNKKAEEYIDRAIGFFKNDIDSAQYGRLLNNKANIQFVEKNYDKAWNTYDKAEKKLAAETFDAYSTISLNRGLIILNCNEALLDSLQIKRTDRFITSWNLLSQAEKIAKESKDNSTLINIYDSKADWFEKRGDCNNALREIRKRDEERTFIASESAKIKVAADVFLLHQRIYKDKLRIQGEKVKEDEEILNLITILFSMAFGILLFVVVISVFGLSGTSKFAFLPLKVLGLIGVTSLIEAVAFGIHFVFHTYVTHNPVWILLGITGCSVPLLYLHKSLVTLLERKYQWHAEN